jgi:hypothetical protein
VRFLIFLLLSASCFAQEILRPTTDANSAASIGCLGVVDTSTAMPSSYDAAGIPTGSTQTDTNATRAHQAGRKFLTWQTTSNTYSALTLNINTASVGWLASGGAGNACLAYSVNNGSTWTNVICDTGGSGWPQQTFSISLSASQNLSFLQVAACAQGGAIGGGSGSDSVTIFDIWTIGTTSGQGPGNGSTAGAPHRGVVAVN